MKDLILVFGIALVVLAGCQSSPSSAPVPTPTAIVAVEDLVGVWRFYDLDFYFNKDGTYCVIKVSDLDDYPDYPEAAGTFWFGGGRLKLQDTDGFDRCETAQIGSYEVQRVTKDHLMFVLVEDQCQGRAKALTLGPWLRTSPTKDCSSAHP